MEHLEGQTLAARLERGQLSLDETLQCATQIADALDKAHREGVVHRDLKPANIMLTPSGPKLLDFGLAKLRSPEGNATPATVSAMPTDARNLTMDGAILGTLQYMSPEQLEGKEADARSDIFSFGATLYEMAAGKRAFEGKSQVSLMAAILEHAPKPLSQLVPSAPSSFERLLQICLEKDPEDRLQTMREVSRELKWISDHPRESPPLQETARHSRHSSWAGWAAAFLFLLIAAGFAAAYFFQTAPPPLTFRFSIAAPDGTNFSGGGGAPRMAISPDGKQVAFGVGRTDATSMLWIYQLDSGESRMLAGTEAAQQLKAVTGFGDERLLLASDQSAFASDWSADGHLFYHRFNGNTRDIYALPTTGEPKPIPVQTTRFDEFDAKLSLNGRWLAFVSNESGPNQIYVRSFPGEEQKWQISQEGGLQPHWRADGKELFFRDLDGNLMAVRTDLGGGSAPGIPVTLFNANLFANLPDPQYAVTSDGQRFLIRIPAAAQTTTPITIVVNWQGMLRR